MNRIVGITGLGTRRNRRNRPSTPGQTIKTADSRPRPARARSTTVTPDPLTSTFEDGESSLHIGVLAYPGCFASSVYGVPDMLTMATHLSSQSDADPVTSWVSIVSPRSSVTAAGGVPIAVAPLASVADQLDLLIVPGYETPSHDLDTPLRPLRPEVAAIAAHAAAGRPVVSTCVGAFLLGAGGPAAGPVADVAVSARARVHPTAPQPQPASVGTYGPTARLNECYLLKKASFIWR